MNERNQSRVPVVEMELTANPDTLRQMVAGIEDFVNLFKESHSCGCSDRGRHAFDALLKLTENCLENQHELPSGLRLALHAITGSEWKRTLRRLKKAIVAWDPTSPGTNERPVPAIWDTEESLRAWNEEESAESSRPEAVRQQDCLARIEQDASDVIELLTSLSVRAELKLVGRAAPAQRPARRRTREEVDTILSEDCLRNEALFDFLRKGVDEGQQAAHRLAREYFGRNKLATRLGLSDGSVSESDVYKSIQAQLRLDEKSSAFTAIGIDIATERAAELHQLPAEAFALIERLRCCADSSLIGESLADAFIRMIRENEVPLDRAEEMIARAERGENPLS